MKQKLLKTMLLLSALVVGGGNAWGQVASVAPSDGGSYVVAAYVNSKYYALPNGSVNGGTITGKEITLNALKKVNTDDAEGLIWILEEGSNSNAGKYYFKYTSGTDTYYLYKNGTSSSNKNFAVNKTSKNYWSFTTNGTGYTVAAVDRGTNRLNIECSSGTFQCSGTATPIRLLEVGDVPSKTASDLTITNTENTINLAIGGTTTGDITYTTSSDGTMHFTSNNTSVATVNASGTVTAVAEGSTTITVSQDEGTSYAASSNLSVTINVSDARTAVGTITEISPTTVYVGQIDNFTLTQNMTGTVSSYAWSLGSGEDAYLTLADETFEGVAEGDVTVTVTATPTDASTYKPVTASFPVSVEYKYAAPSLPAAAAFFSTKSITIPAIAGADVYYTTDGSTPTKSSTKYTAAFEVSATKTVKAIAIDEDGLVSPVASATYTKEDVLDINLTEVTFEDFSGAGSGYDNGAEKNLTFTATDGETKLKITGTNIMSNSGLQVRSTPGTFTTQYIKNAEKAFSLTATFTNGLSYKISYADGSDDTSGTLTSGTAIIPNSFPCKFTFTRSSGTPVITKIVLTPLKDPVATEVAITDPGTLAKDDTGTFAYTATTEEDNTASWTSTTTGVITITNAATGAYTATGRGTSKITLTLTPTDDTTYREVTAQRTITVTAPVEVSADDVEMTYGDAAKAIGATKSAEYAGTLTYESGNTNIATVDASGNVTAVAAGTTIITISAPADASHYYSAGEDVVINVTVNAPAGGTEAKTNDPVNIVNSTLTSTTWPTGWTQTSTNNDWSGWSATTNGLAGTGYESSSIRHAGTFDLISPEFDLSGCASASVTFSHAGRYFGNPSEEALLLIKVGDADPVSLTINNYFSNTDWTAVSNTTSLNAYVGNRIRLIFRNISDGTSDHCGTWDIKSLTITGTQPANISATLNASGYATFCSQYPLDFSGASDYSAWQITAANSSTGVITFSQITGAIKGGTGILLKGTANATVTLTSADSENVLSGNKLFGTTAPTYVSANEYYGLSGNQFVKVNAGTVPAGKALLPAGEVSGVKSFTFIFEGATGVRTVEKVSAEEAEAIFNLAGQRIQKPQRGINIINGRKVVVK